MRMSLSPAAVCLAIALGACGMVPSPAELPRTAAATAAAAGELSRPRGDGRSRQR